MPKKTPTTPPSTSSADWSRCMIYGAYGYTGELTVSLCRERGIRPVLAGRSAAKLLPLAQSAGMAHMVVGLDDPAALDASLADIDVVLHCAGPFSRTSKPMLDACLRTGTHYLDITGEVVVFEACAARDAEAKDAGVMVMPGTGFDVVPTDCLAVHLKQRLPSATSLELAFRSVGGVLSHGTATTMVESLNQPSMVRRDGRLQPIRVGSLRRQVDFGRGPTHATAIPWGDLSTAWYSTGIPNITVYMAMPKGAAYGMLASSYVNKVFGWGPVQRRLKSWIDGRPAGPDATQRGKGLSIVWGRAQDPSGASVEARLRTPNGYTLTAAASLGIARRVLEGDAPAGFQTPGKAYGADLVLEVAGTERTDL